MEALYFRVSVFLGFLAGAVIFALPLRRQLSYFHEFVQRTPPMRRAFLALLAAAFIAYGGGKTNQVGQTGATSGVAIAGGVTNVVDVVEGSENEIASCGGAGRAALPSRVSALPSPVSCLASSAPRLVGGCAMTGGAVLASNWWLRGCWEDCRKVEFADGWVFPFGTSHLASVVVMSQGEVRTGFCDAAEIAALGAKVALVPFDSRFCHEHTPSNSYRFTWDRAYVNRDTNAPMTAAVELFRNGDVCVTTNGVAAFTPYEIPFPHVGAGQNDDWVRTNFMDAAEILSAGYAEWVDAQVGVGLENGLYKFTATFPADPPEATELFVGGLSVCVTNAGEYVFLLEKGVEYSFGTNPFDATVEYSMRDDPEDAPVFAAWWGGGEASGEWTVDGGWQWISLPTPWGFGACLWVPKFRGAPDVERLGVGDFPMTFEAVLTDFRHADGVTYHWSSDSEKVYIRSPDAQATQVEVDSTIVGDMLSLAVEAQAQGRTYRSTLCYRFPSNDAQALSLSMPDVLFVNNDDDNDDGIPDCDRRIPSGDPFVCDDDVVGAAVGLPAGVSRGGTLSLLGKGGFYGTVFDAAVENDYVGLGSEWEVGTDTPSPLSLEVCGSLPSDGYRSSQLKFRWSPDDGDEQTVLHRFTVVEPVVEPICGNTIDVVENGVPRKLTLNPCGVGIGRDAYFRIAVEPEDYPGSLIEWQTDGAGVVSFVGGNKGREVCVRGVSEGDLTLNVDIGGCTAAKPSFPLRVVDNVQVKLSVWIIENDKGEQARTEGEVRDMVKEANDIFAQVGMSFYIDSITVTNINEAYKVQYHGETADGCWSFDQVANIASGTGGVECYFIGSFLDAQYVLAANDTHGMLLSARANGMTFAHELGHVCGLEDVYDDFGGKAISPFETFEWRHAMEDWNGGSYGSHTVGSRYYRHSMNLCEIVGRLLMLGVCDSEADRGRDISTGYVDGLYKCDDNDLRRGSVNTGIFRGLGTTRRPVHQ